MLLEANLTEKLSCIVDEQKVIILVSEIQNENQCLFWSGLILSKPHCPALILGSSAFQWHDTDLFSYTTTVNTITADQSPHNNQFQHVAAVYFSG